MDHLRTALNMNEQCSKACEQAIRTAKKQLAVLLRAASMRGVEVPPESAAFSLHLPEDENHGDAHDEAAAEDQAGAASQRVPACSKDAAEVSLLVGTSRHEALSSPTG